jgi:hypothetical protein
LDKNYGPNEESTKSKAPAVKKSKSLSSSAPHDVMDTKKNRSLMIANAVKLNGLDSL